MTYREPLDRLAELTLRVKEGLNKSPYVGARIEVQNSTAEAGDAIGFANYITNQLAHDIAVKIAPKMPDFVVQDNNLNSKTYISEAYIVTPAAMAAIQELLRYVVGELERHKSEIAPDAIQQKEMEKIVKQIAELGVPLDTAREMYKQFTNMQYDDPKRQSVNVPIPKPEIIGIDPAAPNSEDFSYVTISPDHWGGGHHIVPCKVVRKPESGVLDVILEEAAPIEFSHFENLKTWKPEDVPRKKRGRKKR